MFSGWTTHEAGGFNPRGSEYGKLRGVARDWNDGATLRDMATLEDSACDRLGLLAALVAPVA
jgi:hypothetical protein